MTKEQFIVAIIGAVLGFLGGGAGAALGFWQFLIKRKDEKEEKDMQTLINKAVEKAKQDLHDEFRVGLESRGEEGKERFETHQKSIADINERIESNSKQIEQILGIVKDQAEKYDVLAESLTALNTVSKANAEATRSNNYDRFLIVAKKALKSKQLTISEKTNMVQLYTSYKELGGEDPIVQTYYEECMKLTPVPDEDRN